MTKGFQFPHNHKHMLAGFKKALASKKTPSHLKEHIRRRIAAHNLKPEGDPEPMRPMPKMPKSKLRGMPGTDPLLNTDSDVNIGDMAQGQSPEDAITDGEYGNESPLPVPKAGRGFTGKGGGLPSQTRMTSSNRVSLPKRSVKGPDKPGRMGGGLNHKAFFGGGK